MSLIRTQVEGIAHLARLEITEAQMPVYVDSLSRIIDFVEQLAAADTAGVEPMAHPLADQVQRLRPDVVSETDQREKFQHNTKYCATAGASIRFAGVKSAPRGSLPPRASLPFVMFQTHGKYYKLYVNARHQAWDPGAIDLAVDRDHWAMIQRDHAAERFPEQILLLCSLIAAGEQSVTETLSPFLAAMGRAGLGVDKELFLTSQVYDEARHFEFFARYFAEVLADTPPLAPPAAPRAVLVDDLADVANRIRREDDGAALRRLLVEGVSHYLMVTSPTGSGTVQRSRFEMLLGAKEHEMHHRAQLMLIERQLGIIPHLKRQMNQMIEQITKGRAGS